MEIRIGAVLDHSALVAYARLDGLAVGELLMVLAENSDVAGVPAGCLLSAHEALGDDHEGRRRLAELATHPDIAVAVLPLMGPDVVDVMTASGKAAELIGRHAVIEAHRRRVPLATYEAATARTEVHDVLDLAAH
ncbi:hypothetical protein J2S43_001918 [Catenuloplanes nepalensis]|uniref:PIN domain-containing protein n=1 Tax=Catenuloplanes nepalensis TaxID=587533 RepID=A0ABT9MPQ6_9ACTN|nr:hypothetical protein [Catenuloplanes nepalensis]MDP9793406.1 hypothetical protein [Catenuloplanes nepalensis]